MSNTKQTPHFKDEAQERAFWESNDSSEFVDWNKAQPVVMANLKPSTKPSLCVCQRAYLRASSWRPISVICLTNL